MSGWILNYNVITVIIGHEELNGADLSGIESKSHQAIKG